jgi:hypothetical protein
MNPIMYSEACECSDLENTFEYAKINESLEKTQVKTIHQNNLSSECWMVQINGLKECETCEFKGKRDCGGKNIRKTGKNALGLTVPIS